MNVPDPAVQQARSASVAGLECLDVSPPAVRSAESWRLAVPATNHSGAKVVVVTLSFVLDLISTVSIVFGVGFGLVQLRQYRLERVRTSSLELLRYFQTPECSRALLLVYSLPDNLSRAQIEERIGAEFSTVYALLATWESLGILVFRNEMDLDLVEDFFSGPIVLSWKKLRRCVEEHRMELGRQTIGEWLQWLAERMEDRESQVQPIPAHLQHKDWRPRVKARGCVR